MPMGWHFSCPLLSSLHPHWEAKDSFESIHTDPLQKLHGQGAQRSITQRMQPASNLLFPIVSPSFYYWAGVAWEMSIGD